ncbi:MAG: hypothetical protein U0821_17375 [Chloroflexota bacterium]
MAVGFRSRGVLARRAAALALIVALLATFAPLTGSSGFADAGAGRGEWIKATPISDYQLLLPTNAYDGRPVQLLVALHGMGGNGADLARSLGPDANQRGWAVLAPTMSYGDYRDPEQVRRDGALLTRLKALIDVLPSRTGVTFAPRVLLFGFSRGSQEVNRFAMMYPELTAAVAGVGAGAYTLPLTQIVGESASADRGISSEYPFGVANIEAICGRTFSAVAAQKVPFWIGVGAQDNRPQDVPRQWDALLGSTRLERARRYTEALSRFGAPAELHIYASAAHEFTDAMRSDIFQFLDGRRAPAVAST